MVWTRRDLFARLLGRQIGKAADPGARIRGPFQIDARRCTAWGQGICARCEQVCVAAAILSVGMMDPRVLPQRCTACGDCEDVCPTGAIAATDPIGEEA